MTIEEREAEPYDERKVMETIVKGGPNVIKAHLEHLREHEEYEFLKQALEFLKENGIENPLIKEGSAAPKAHHGGGGCPGSRSQVIKKKVQIEDENGKRVSHLEQWPIQLHLVPPTAPYYRNSDLLLAADCVAFTYPDFHKDFLKGKSLAIACPKLDSNQEVYVEKLDSMINDANINSITVMIMQVPCCGGLFQMAQHAIEKSDRTIPLKAVVVGINGEILKEIDVN